MFRRFAIVIAATCLVAAPALTAPPDGFDARVEALRKEMGIPGLAIAIVENGETTLARGYGVRKLGGNAPVDANTIFPTGSTGKAVTVAALAILVDQGRIAWDDKVIDHIPWFQMYDPWVTREMTVRDLLVHRSGYAYDNILYMVAGQLIEEVTGKTWENFIAEHVFKPAGMEESTSHGAGRFATANRAFPHARLDGGLRGAGHQELLDERDELGRNAAPAGGLAMSASDLARWLSIQLAHGKLPEGEGRLYSEAQAREMWTPVVLQPIQELPEALKPTQPNFDTYALGWDVRDYRGAKIVWHGGAVFGSLTAVVLIPEEKVGFSITINSEDGEMIRGLMYELLDHYLGQPRANWPEKWTAFKQERVAAGLKALATQQSTPADIGPSLPVARYAGVYKDPWYGRIAIGQGKDGLTIEFTETPRMAGKLEHYQYDTFITRFDDAAIEPAYVTFGLDADGKVERITMKAVSPLADFSYDYHDLLFRPVEAAK